VCANLERPKDGDDVQRCNKKTTNETHNPTTVFVAPVALRPRR
jgi:hypothetical protein